VKRLKPGPKVNAKLRHKKAAMYFCSVGLDEGWSPHRVAELCFELYGLEVTPFQVTEFAEMHAKFADKINWPEFRVENDLRV
jgi:hypothetical protein